MEPFVTSFENFATEECLDRDVPEAKRWKNKKMVQRVLKCSLKFFL